MSIPDTSTDTLHQTEWRYNRVRHAPVVANTGLFLLLSLLVLVGSLPPTSLRIGLGMGLILAYGILVACNYSRHYNLRMFSRAIALHTCAATLLFGGLAIAMNVNPLNWQPLLVSAGIATLGLVLGIFTIRAQTSDALIVSITDYPALPLPPPNELDSFDLQKWDEAPKP